MPALFNQRFELSRIPQAFLLTTGITLLFWFINILLLYGGQPFPSLKINWVRYVISVAISLIVLSLIFNFIIPKPVSVSLPPELSRQWMMLRNQMPIGGQMKFRPPVPGFFPHVQAQTINIIVIVLLELVLLRDRKQQVENENNQLRVANLEARNSQLQQQLHPHFLFNSLSTLRSLIKRSPEQAEDYLVKLSDLLRFSTRSNAQMLVSLSEELDLCTNYLNMQKVRFGEALFFHIDVPTPLQLLGKVPVYSVQQLAENAIKHNTLTIAQPLHITINGDSAHSTITVTNNLQPKQEQEASTGLGLTNLAERYQLLGEEEVRTKKTEVSFAVTIKVMHYESSNR